MTTHTTKISLTTCLTILFVTLKLLDKITWSWLWVLSPLWISAALSLAVLSVIGITMLLVIIFGNR